MPPPNNNLTQTIVVIDDFCELSGVIINKYGVPEMQITKVYFTMGVFNFFFINVPPIK